ncbi:phosphonate metabolism protein PhnP [uncultured Endozoicomonas sp.]|uniref:phosphonate metabolism protein PhnP n=1 Tax=uncultured Endozoicomonas sp. TaxID=432652 RepID=UPI0026350715|nr:phosphonate metabolism protein PhnP [uncultured Endozoicomonas sp.]
MKFTLLGTGSVKGCPVYGCDCPACINTLMNPFLTRRSASATLESEGELILIDAGLTDLEDRFPAGTLRQILLTHYHMDHIAGLFSLRWGRALNIPVYGPDCDDAPVELIKHTGILDFTQAITPFARFLSAGIEITPLPLKHSRPTYGYQFRQNGKNVIYLTDTLGLPDETLTYLARDSIDVMIIDCSYPPNLENFPGAHNSLTDVIHLHEAIHPARTILTHIGHEMDHWMSTNTLPENIEPGHDGMVIMV